MRRLATAVLVFGIMSASTAAFAGGSLFFREVRPILENDPLGRWLLSEFEFADSASGTRLGSHFAHLGGARIGPYYVSATAKDTSLTLLLQIETDITYFAGKENLWSGQATFGDIPDQLFTRITKEADRYSESFRGVHLEVEKKVREPVQ